MDERSMAGTGANEMTGSIVTCRFCGTRLRHPFADLGLTPFANSYLTMDEPHRMEPFYPLRAYVCDACFLVQLPVFLPPEEIFGNYAYFSSYSDSWLQHVKSYAGMMTKRFSMDTDWMVIEIASNDGYLLQYFKEKGIPVLGIEPARNVAKSAQDAGIPTVVRFFGENTATELAAANTYADLLIGNNVLAHVPDINDFVKGMKIVLRRNGLITMEFPHLLKLIEGNQFDTIYHEHFSYLSLLAVKRIFDAHGLTIFDVEELSTHGGSLRIYARHSDDSSRPVGREVADLIDREIANGFTDLDYYLNFGERLKEAKRDILDFLIGLKREQKKIAGYGAPAKGNTLLNYCGIRTDFIDFTVDRSPHKQHHLLPGTRIPIFHPDRIKEERPDYLLILPWNLKEEIMGQMGYVREWGGRFVVLIPEIKVYA